MKGLAWIRGKNTRAIPSMEMMACAKGTRTELQVMISGLWSHHNECMKPWTKCKRCHFINIVQRLFQVLRHLIIGPGPCNFEIHKYRLFLESVCVGKQEIGLISDPSTKGHEIPPSSSIYTALRAPFRLWVLFRLKVRHSCNFAYFVCVQRPDKGVTEPHLDQ